MNLNIQYLTFEELVHRGSTYKIMSMWELGPIGSFCSMDCGTEFRNGDISGPSVDTEAPAWNLTYCSTIIPKV